MKRLRITWIGLIASAILTSGMAQTAPPDPATQTGQDPAKEQGKDPIKKDQEQPPAKEGEQPKKEEDKTAPEKYNTLSVGYSVRTYSGLRARLEQYASPPRGFTLYTLDYTRPMEEKNPHFFRFIFNGTPGEDFVMHVQGETDHGKILVRGFSQHNSYSEPDWQPHQQSRYDLDDYTVRVALGADAGAYMRYRGQDRKRGFYAPYPNQDYGSQMTSVGVEGKLLGGQAGVAFVDSRFFDHTDLQPHSLRSTWLGHYTVPLGNAVTFNANASTTKIEQTGLRNGFVRRIGASAVWDVLPTTSLTVMASQDNIDLNNVLNAYARRRLLTGGRLDHWWHGGGAAFAVTHREDERVRADHLYVDVPKWNVFEYRAWQRFNPFFRLTTKGNWQNLSSAATMQTEDPRQLYWSFKSDFEVRAEAGNATTTAYAGFRYRFRDNADRDFNVGWSQWTAGLSRQFKPNLLGYAEVAYDKFRARGTDPDTGDTLGQYFPDSLSEAFGLDWTRRPGEVFTGALVFAIASNSRVVQPAFTYRRDLGQNRSLELVFAPWKYDDRQFDITGYRASIFQARYVTRF